MQYGNQDKVKSGQQQPGKSKEADFKNRPNMNQQGQKGQQSETQFDAQQPIETGFSQERPYTEAEHKDLERPTSAIDAQMNTNKSQKNESTQAAKATQREDLNDEDPITGVDKSLGTDSQWSGQKQDPKPGPIQPQVGQKAQPQGQKNASDTSGPVGKNQQPGGALK